MRRFDVSKVFQLFIIIFLFAFVGISILGSGQVFATGSFNVPTVNDHFEKVQPGPASEKEPSLSQTPQKEQGTLDWLTKPLKNVWNWTKEKASEAWEWTKETASTIWNWMDKVIAKISEVVVDALSAVWNWMMEHKGITITILSIIGIIVAIVGFVFEVAIAALVGVGVLLGEIVGALISWFSGSGFLSEEMLRDIIIGGIAGGISGLAGYFAEFLAEFLIGETGVLASIGSRIPWLSRAFPKMFGNAVMAGTDQGITDYLKTGKFNLKRAMVAAAFGFFLGFGGWYISGHLDGIITKINGLSLSPAFEVFPDGTASAPKTIGDTPFGQWLQKFASKSNGKKYASASFEEESLLKNSI